MFLCMLYYRRPVEIECMHVCVYIYTLIYKERGRKYMFIYMCVYE